MRRAISIICILVLGFLWWPVRPARSVESLEMGIKPASLEVDMFFTGGLVTISGSLPAGEDVVIEITGPTVEAECDIKGRVGPFWMNRQKVRLENVPSLYALLVPPGSEWEGRLLDLGLGFGKLKTGVQVGRSDLPGEEILAMYMNLKKSEGLFSENFGAVTYSAQKDGLKRFRVDYHLPSSTPAGNYAIRAFGLEDGTLRGETAGTLTVREKGFVKLIDEMASHQRLLYGVLSVVIALLAGGIMGVLFKGGGGH